MDEHALSYLVSFVALLAFLGNVLITLVGLRLPAHPKNLTQVFLISLSVADILLSLQVPFYVLGLQNDHLQLFPDGTASGVYAAGMEPLCSVSAFLLWVAIKTNIFMVTTMGMDRMAATCYAATYLKVVRRQYAVSACVVIWIGAVVLACLPGVMAWTMGDENPYSFDTQTKTCSPLPNFCKESEGNKSYFVVYFLIELSFTFLLPLLCIIICYICICSKIFNLKKIRTISRHFSRRQKKIFKTSKGSKVKGVDKDQSAHKTVISNPEKTVISNPEKTVISNPEKTVISNPEKTEPSFQGLKVNSIVSESDIVPDSSLSSSSTFRLNTRSGGGLYPTHQLPECSEETCGDPPPLLPNTVVPEPPSFSIDPSMQRRRFNFFTPGEEGDDKYSVCVEPDSKAGIINSSLNVIEKHYKAIETAREELAKKMRVYKYQIRVARTAVIVCTFFFVCYLLYEVAILLIVLQVSCEEGYSYSGYIHSAHLSLYINSALNVCIYGMMHRTVRASMTRICRMCRAGSQASSTT